MRKYNGLSNVTGRVIEQALKEKEMTQDSLCNELKKYGINMDRYHLYRMMTNSVIIKDFELLAICKILSINFDDLIKTIK